jgi:hypothetical protein
VTVITRFARAAEADALLCLRLAHADLGDVDNAIIRSAAGNPREGGIL